MEEDAKKYFERIYDSTQNMVLSYIISKCGNTDSINDIFQETYTELYKLILKRGASYITNDKGIVMELAKQQIYRHYRFVDKVRDRFLLFNSLQENSEYDTAEIKENFETVIEDKIVNDELMNKINNFLEKKPQIVQKIFFMYYYLELSISEVAVSLSMSESNVKHKIYRTLKELRKLYKN